MKWTKEDTLALQEYKKRIDDDNIKIKEKIKEKLIQNRNIIHVLNNKELEKNDSEPDDYYGVNIFPYYIVEKTQVDVENYICYETQYDEVDRYNDSVKFQQIVFYILCEKRNVVDKDTGLARHDLLGALIKDEFNFTNYFGAKIKCISDKPSVVDNDFACRTLIFKQITDNNLVKTKDKIPRLVNKEIHI